MSKGRVLVAMSGGVDSSVAAALLIAEGYECIGATMRLSDSTAAVERARCVAEALGIAWHVFDMRREFREEVMEYFAASYMGGRTPNPCVMCNQKVKFGLLADKAISLGCHYLATGHYAQILFAADRQRWCLAKGYDRHKDQSYYLYRLTQNQLAATLLPLGRLTKKQVRAMADDMRLPTAKTQESQDICFIEDGDYRAFVREQWPQSMRRGPIVDPQGLVLGEHEGLAFYTLGQRKGLGVSAPQPLYVLELDPDRNAVVVGDAQALYASELVADEVNWVSFVETEEPRKVSARVRYRAEPADALIVGLPDGQVKTRFDRPQRAVTPGQSVVWYKEDLVVGGGIIAR